jgi:hypothetical protein
MLYTWKLNQKCLAKRFGFNKLDKAQNIVLNLLYYCQKTLEHLLFFWFILLFSHHPPPLFLLILSWITSEDNTASCNNRITYLIMFRHKYMLFIFVLLSLHRMFRCGWQAAVQPTYELKWNFARNMCCHGNSANTEPS